MKAGVGKRRPQSYRTGRRARSGYLSAVQFSWAGEQYKKEMLVDGQTHLVLIREEAGAPDAKVRRLWGRAQDGQPVPRYLSKRFPKE